MHAHVTYRGHNVSWFYNDLTITSFVEHNQEKGLLEDLDNYFLNDNSLRWGTKSCVDPELCPQKILTENGFSSQHHLHRLYMDMASRFSLCQDPCTNLREV